MPRHSARACVVATLLFVASLPARAGDGPLTEGEARRLLEEAATVVEPAVFQVLGRVGASREAILRESASLAYVALARLPNARNPSLGDDDLRFYPDATYAKLAEALAEGTPFADLRDAPMRLSLLREGTMEMPSLRPVDDDWATGEVRFWLADVIVEGHLLFVARRHAGQWAIEGFEFPTTKLRVARSSDGRWRVTSAGGAIAKGPAPSGRVRRAPQFRGPSDPPPPPEYVGPPAATDTGAPHGRPPPCVPVSNDAVEDALKWLAAHQSADGGWECEGFRKWCDGKQTAGDGPDGAGNASYDVGVTGLALLAFLGAGYTNRSDGPFGKVVANGLRFLRNVQDEEGCFGSRSSSHFIYNHAIAALAMVEAYGMTGSTNYKTPAQKALHFTAICRNPYAAWRYGVKPGENDTSVTGWMTMALASARATNTHEANAGKPPVFQIDEAAFDGVKAWLDKMTDPDSGRVGYTLRGGPPARSKDQMDRFPAEKSESMTAVGVFTRMLLGANPKTNTMVKKGVELLADRPPTWNPRDGSIDFTYWYFGTLATYQAGGDAWTAWESAMKSAIVGSQRTEGDRCGVKGSWDPIDPWGPDGGRVYSTALMALACEVWFRYDRVFGTRAVR